ncbi:MAG: response regulator [Desulfobacteraceae bacterium]|jgi:twitching motility two-component system response regulator PilH
MSSERILIVEDSPTAMLQITTILQDKGYKLLHAVDGEEALQKAADELPHLIVLDVILPKKNGFQVCRHLKKTTQTKGIKILMLTSKTQESDRFWGLKQGADDYMTKPFEPGDLLQKVDELLH